MDPYRSRSLKRVPAGKYHPAAMPVVFASAEIKNVIERARHEFVCLYRNAQEMDWSQVLLVKYHS